MDALDKRSKRSNSCSAKCHAYRCRQTDEALSSRDVDSWRLIVNSGNFQRNASGMVVAHQIIADASCLSIVDFFKRCSQQKTYILCTSDKKFSQNKTGGYRLATWFFFINNVHHFKVWKQSLKSVLTRNLDTDFFMIRISEQKLIRFWKYFKNMQHIVAV